MVTEGKLTVTRDTSLVNQVKDLPQVEIWETVLVFVYMRL